MIGLISNFVKIKLFLLFYNGIYFLKIIKIMNFNFEYINRNIFFSEKNLYFLFIILYYLLNAHKY
jgi:hypothetical protein